MSFTKKLTIVMPGVPTDAEARRAEIQRLLGPDVINNITSKAIDFTIEGKMKEVFPEIVNNDPYTYNRYLKDQAAVDEWLSFAQPMILAKMPSTTWTTSDM